jgi:beta-barrel assembly-enhancing protease
MNTQKNKTNIKRRHAAVAAAALLAAAGGLGIHVGCKGGGGDVSAITNALGGSIGVGGSGAGGSQTSNLVSGATGVVQGLQGLSVNATQEDAMGQSAAVSLTNKYRLSDDKALNAYVSKVGLALVNASPRPVGNWLFGVLESDEVNAFAGPNGYIFVTRGALTRMDDEAELAGVLGHEITHVLHHHGLAAVNTGGFTGLARAGSQIASAFSREWGQFAQLFDVGVDVVIDKGYAKAQEIDADTNAVDLMVGAGYDPNSYVRFLRKLEGGGGLFSTHPGGAERTAKVQQRIGEIGARGGATLRDRFERNVRRKA